MKVIFMGTPDFALPTLQSLISDPQIEIVAVYTKEPQIAGRGQKITNSPVHNLALANNLPVYNPSSLKDKTVQEQFLNFHADFAVVVAYGLILPSEILEGTEFGCINLHPSLLPKWRGAAPIQRAIMNGDLTTGINIIKMDRGIDSGDIIAQEIMPLYQDITYPDLSSLLAKRGAEILTATLHKIQKGDYQLTKQDSGKAIYAQKINKSEAVIDWNLDAIHIKNLIRALSHNPGAYFIHNGQRLKIHQANVINKDEKNAETGKVKIIDEQMLISCRTGYISPIIVQKEGKNSVAIAEFLRGLRNRD